MTTSLYKRLRVCAGLLLLAAQAAAFPARAAELQLGEGVVVKFGADAQLVVRDRLTAGQGAVLTSQKDDSVAGQTGASAQVPLAGDWRGISVEKSAAAFG